MCFVLSSDLKKKTTTDFSTSNLFPTLPCLEILMIPQTVPCGTSFPLLPPASPSGFTFTGSGTRAGGKTCECFFTGKLLPYFMRKLRSVNGQEPTQRHSRTQSPAVVYLTCQGQAFSTFLYTVCFIEILQVLLSMLNIYKRTGHLY